MLVQPPVLSIAFRKSTVLALHRLKAKLFNRYGAQTLQSLPSEEVYTVFALSTSLQIVVTRKHAEHIPFALHVITKK